MALLLNQAGGVQYLTVTGLTVPITTAWIVLFVWAKFAGPITGQTEAAALALTNAGTAERMHVRVSNPTAAAPWTRGSLFQFGYASEGAAEPTALASGAWGLLGAMHRVDGTTAQARHRFDETGTITTGLGARTGSVTAPLDRLMIGGEDAAPAAARSWYGSLSHAGLAQADTEAHGVEFIGALALQRPHLISVTGCSLIWYRDLISGASGTGNFGAAPSTVGTPSFDADQPSLSGGSGGGGGAPLLASAAARRASGRFA
jgi:hypothetical protein